MNGKSGSFSNKEGDTGEEGMRIVSEWQYEEIRDLIQDKKETSGISFHKRSKNIQEDYKSGN